MLVRTEFVPILSILKEFDRCFTQVSFMVLIRTDSCSFRAVLDRLAGGSLNLQFEVDSCQFVPILSIFKVV